MQEYAEHHVLPTASACRRLTMPRPTPTRPPATHAQKVDGYEGTGTVRFAGDHVETFDPYYGIEFDQPIGDMNGGCASVPLGLRGTVQPFINGWMDRARVPREVGAGRATNVPRPSPNGSLRTCTRISLLIMLMRARRDLQRAHVFPVPSGVRHIRAAIPCIGQQRHPRGAVHAD